MAQFMCRISLAHVSLSVCLHFYVFVCTHALHIFLVSVSFCDVVSVSEGVCVCVCMPALSDVVSVVSSNA